MTRVAPLDQNNHQIESSQVTITNGCHFDASITQSPRKPKTQPTYELVNDREERDDESNTQAHMQVVKVNQLGVDSDAHWVKKCGQVGVD